MARPKRAGRWWLAAAGVFGVLLVLSMVDDHKGQPLLGEGIVVQTLATAGLLGAAGLAAWPKLREFAADVRIVREEVKNSHAINFRDDIDGKHDETTTQNARIVAQNDRIEQQVEALRELFDRRLDGVASDVRGIRKDIGRHADKLDTHDEELKTLRAKDRALERKVGDE